MRRDIKSANAVVTPRGQVKVLDFRLARQAVDDAAALDSRLSTQAQTQVGVVMGTVPYMSPEQALGRDADARTDLFSLGMVLYELWGREFLVGNQREMDKSVESFRKAIARAPDYALARAGLASASAIQACLRGMDRAEVLDEARIAVERALELDPELAEAHAASVRAAELDPLSVGPVHDIAINHMVRHDYEQAAAHFRRAIDINPNWTWGYIKLARTLAHQRKCEKALAQAGTGLRRIADGVAPTSRAWLGYTWALCGENGRAREQLAWLEDLARTQYVDPTTFATVLAGLGETEAALDWLEKAYEERSPAMVYAGLWPQLDPNVEDDPRLRSIIRRMGFPSPGR